MMARTLVVDGDHLKRLMNVCRMIGSGQGSTLKQLQVKLRTSRRTIFRDLNTLEKIGVELELDEDGYKTRQSAAQCRKQLVDHQLQAVNKLLAVCLK
jgi:predicted DNA-binding transcriptional regulator YafY